MASSVPRLHDLTRTRFDEFASRNLPVIVTDATQLWRSSREWADPTTGAPDVCKLGALFGHHAVTVHTADGQCSEMSVKEYASLWNEAAASTSEGGNGSAFPYLKDWHLAALEPDYAAYEVPSYLGEDWLNEHWTARAAAGSAAATATGGDHRFVYVGPAGSRTRLHADVLFSYSWSANVVGRKRWRLVPSELRHSCSDGATRPLASDLSALPEVAPIEIVQNAGELLFVPSGWYHEVENLEDTISINHNWLNAHNVHWAAVKLSEVLADVKAGLSADDASDGELCEDLLDRRCGMGLCGLCELLEGVIARRRTAPPDEGGGGGGDGGGGGGGGGGTRSGSGSTTAAERAFGIQRAAATLGKVLELIEEEYELESLDPAMQAAVVRQGELLRELQLEPAAAAPPAAAAALGPVRDVAPAPAPHAGNVDMADAVGDETGRESHKRKR